MNHLKYRIWQASYTIPPRAGKPASHALTVPSKWADIQTLVRQDGSIVEDHYGLQNVMEPVTVEQFTGLTDTTGKPVYEGDIVDVGWHSTVMRCVVTFWYGELRGIRLDWYRDHGVPDHTATGNLWYQSLTDTLTSSPRGVITVVGNVHEQPELLETARG